MVMVVVVTVTVMVMVVVVMYDGDGDQMVVMILVVLHLLGQGQMHSSLVWMLVPSHCFPSSVGFGFVHVRVLFTVDPPQGLSHCDHILHSLQPPSTAKQHGKKGVLKSANWIAKYVGRLKEKNDS